MINLNKLKEKAEQLRNKKKVYVSLSIDIHAYISSNTTEITYILYQSDKAHIYFTRVQDLLSYLDTLLSEEEDHGVEIEED